MADTNQENRQVYFAHLPPESSDESEQNSINDESCKETEEQKDDNTTFDQQQTHEEMQNQEQANDITMQENIRDEEATEDMAANSTENDGNIMFRSPFDIENVNNDDSEFWWDDDWEEAISGGKFSSVPQLANWEEIDISEETINITVGGSRRRLWAYAVEEISTIKDNVANLPARIHEHNWVPNNLGKLYNFLFGTNSELFRIFHTFLGINKITYLKFIRTFFLSCKNNQGVAALHSMFDINTSYYMDIGEYNKLWNEISSLSGTLGSLSFWQAIEEVVNNSICQLVFPTSSSSTSNPYLIAIDDDKVHFAWGNNSQTNGLKRCHHAKDNRRGFTVHTAAFPASQIPIGAFFQRDRESVQVTYIRMLKRMFGNGSDVLPDLRNVTLASDRGYWMPRFLFEELLEAGANIEGTVKRVSFICFVCLFCYPIFFYDVLTFF